MPHARGSIEREVQDMVSSTRTVLVAAGLRGCLWSYAALGRMHVGHCLVRPKLGPSAWARRYGEEFRGQLIFVGAVVIFKPSPTNTRTPQTATHGLFGYV